MKSRVIAFLCAVGVLGSIAAPVASATYGVSHRDCPPRECGFNHAEGLV